ncbi:MAG: RNA polymerase sigma factor [Verrucomicrobia bacterium]|nr:RNA polymerase sigma factor [Verrucomicrobiota bacterium]
MQHEFFNSIVHEWYDLLYRFALSLCQNPDDALDLTQSAFFKLSSKGHTLRDRSKTKSWLFSVVHREFIDQYRKRRRYPSTTLELVPEPASDSKEQPGSQIDAADVITILGQMDEKFRAPLTLFYLEYFSYKEISEVLDIPIGTVMSRLRRGKDHLRKRFEKGLSHNTAPIPFAQVASNE